MSELRQRMLDEMQARNYTPKTQRSYIKRIALLVKQVNKPPEELTPEDINDFQYYLLNERKTSKSTVRGYVGTIRFFFGIVLKKEMKIEIIPFPGEEKKIPVILTPDEVARLIAAVENLKYRTVLMGIYSAGLKVTEVCQLRIADIDTKQMVIHVREGSNGKVRDTVLSERYLKQLRQYIYAYRPKGYLFPAFKGGSDTIGTHGIRKTVVNAAKKAGITKQVTAAMLRQCFATHMLEAGVTLETIQKMLGHANVRTTYRFTQVEVKKEEKAVSPLDKIDDEILFFK